MLKNLLLSLVAGVLVLIALLLQDWDFLPAAIWAGGTTLMFIVGFVSERRR